MSGNIFILWKEAADPPLPWMRLSQAGKYIRFTDNVANHLVDVGALNHGHDNTVESVTIGSNADHVTQSLEPDDNCMQGHNHPAPGSWVVPVADNDPAYYGLDIIYMDLTAWEAYEKRFPDGAVILSYAALSSAGFLERFSAADGKLIKNTTPGSTGGSSPKTHTCTATTGSGGITNITCDSGTTGRINTHSHTHTISIDVTEDPTPRTLITRLYEILVQTSNALAGTVAFCDGTPGANWEVLTGWANANLAGGDSDPTLSGSDTHAPALSGSTDPMGHSDNNSISSAGSAHGSNGAHVHSVAGTLKSVSHIPLSIQLVPMRLLNTLYAPSGGRGAQLIGPLW